MILVFKDNKRSFFLSPHILSHQLSQQSLCSWCGHNIWYSLDSKCSKHTSFVLMTGFVCHRPVSSLSSLLCLSSVIDCVFLSASTCWVLLSVAVCVGSRGLVQHSTDTLIDAVLGVEIGGGQMPPTTYWRGATGVSSVLWWCSRHHRGIVITYQMSSFFKTSRQPW